MNTGELDSWGLVGLLGIWLVGGWVGWWHSRLQGVACRVYVVFLVVGGWCYQSATEQH